jgi:succinoglycan biosynthesis protein ExoM
MSDKLKNISVCICTYKRLECLTQLLPQLANQETQNKFTYSIIVVDNDEARSAEKAVFAFVEASPVKVTYCVEPRKNIALARNKAIEHAEGDFVAFIDDDELPGKTWLLELFETCARYEADGALGPVKPSFDQAPPAWIIKGKFYDRPTYPTGHVINWRQGRTGNVLLKRSLFASDKAPFSPSFITGEDQDFFRRMILKKHVFVWCNEAIAFEAVPPSRWKRSFMMKRALLRGKISIIHPTSRWLEIAKSLLAIPIYTIGLPISLLVGQHVFMKYLIKILDHAGKLMAYCKINPVTNTYVTD